jgi:thioredoxin 1
MIVELNEQNFNNETQTGLKLIEFYTTWCTYCRNQRIELEELKNSDMWIGLVDAEESPTITRRFNIEGFPTFILLKNGEQIAKFVGFHQKSQLLNKLMNYLK